MIVMRMKLSIYVDDVVHDEKIYFLHDDDDDDDNYDDDKYDGEVDA